MFDCTGERSSESIVERLEEQVAVDHVPFVVVVEEVEDELGRLGEPPLGADGGVARPVGRPDVHLGLVAVLLEVDGQPEGVVLELEVRGPGDVYEGHLEVEVAVAHLQSLQ